MSKLKLEIMVRLVDGGQLYWDAVERVDLTEDEAQTLRPTKEPQKLDYDTLRPILERVGGKFKEATGLVWTKVLTRLRR